MMGGPSWGYFWTPCGEAQRIAAMWRSYLVDPGGSLLQVMLQMLPDIRNIQSLYTILHPWNPTSRGALVTSRKSLTALFLSQQFIGLKVFILFDYYFRIQLLKYHRNLIL